VGSGAYHTHIYLPMSPITTLTASSAFARVGNELNRTLSNDSRSTRSTSCANDR